MKRTNIYLAEEQARVLKHLAVEQDRSFTDVVREALDEYLSRRGLGQGSTRPRQPRRSIPDDEWRAQMTAVLDRIRSRVPADLRPEEIEAEVTAARDEVRRLRTVRRPTSSG
jgi:hypothetical protein